MTDRGRRVPVGSGGENISSGAGGSVTGGDELKLDSRAEELLQEYGFTGTRL